MLLLLVFFLSLGGCLVVDNLIFYGGFMSFLIFYDDRDNIVKVMKCVYYFNLMLK